MAEEIVIRLKTLTPLWTGGARGSCDRLHPTGIVGSLRWWYEALVRGLGGYACDPTAREGDVRCTFDTKAYEAATRAGADEQSAIARGLATLCPASYLFGATGWARLFQLQVLGSARLTQLHFRTMPGPNRNWLNAIFGGESKNIDGLRVPYGEIRLRLVPRGYDQEYARSQALLALYLAAQYGGLGAKLQHGFGQVEILYPRLEPEAWSRGLRQLAMRLQNGGLRAGGPPTDTPYDLRRFVSLDYEVPARNLAAFGTERSHLGSNAKRDEAAYLPCAFDLRVKGGEKWGLRRWLEDPNGSKRWPHARVSKLLGASEKKGMSLAEADRQAGRVSFGMPYRLPGGGYLLRVFGFAPAELLTPAELRDLCDEYMAYALEVKPIRVWFGHEAIAEARGGEG